MRISRVLLGLRPAVGVNGESVRLSLALMPASPARFWPPLSDLLQFTPRLLPPPFDIHLRLWAATS